VNRNLRMSSVRAIGFDLDHTLAHYRGAEVEELAYRRTRERLVERYGYSPEILEIPYDRRFVIRGLVIDKRRGNILKMDYHNYVARAFHGRALLPAEARKAAYRSGRVRMKNESYVTVDTLFHLPEVFLYVVLVEREETLSRRRRRPYPRIYQDVRESIDSVHGDGTLKREILADPARFLRKDPRLGTTLGEFRRHGKRLFLLTNSELYYTEALLDFLLRNGNGDEIPDWKDLFDIIAVDAGKPVFFTSTPEERPAAAEPGDERVFHGGSAPHLERRLGVMGDEVLYFGDHTYGDILRSKKTLGWRTAMVVEELREEMEVSRRLQPQLDELSHWKALRGVLEADIAAVDLEARRATRKAERRNGESRPKIEQRLKALEARREDLMNQLAEIRRNTGDLGEAVNRAYNPYWGPLFREGSEMSRFAHQVRDFACIYTSHVSNFLHYSPDHYFRSPADLMPHEIH
jgi:HAD superfamily 5'-nucleotidase-like hydrolase